MGKVNLCIAASLDGYIADSNGSVDFLFEKKRVDPDPEYHAFFEEVENILFGRVSYDQIVNEISPEKWLYPGKKCYVFTQDKTAKDDNVIFTDSTPKAFVEEIAAKSAGTTWLFGGAKLIRSFMEEDLIDQYWIYTMPVLLGAGVPLFSPSGERFDLSLVSTSRVDGIVKAFYERIR
ncbi:MAG: dihydrofolate reductase family protein [Oscillospiraceae bacterium]